MARKKPGRQSIAEKSQTNVIALAPRSGPRLRPPSNLNAAEKALFNDAVQSNPHLASGDVQLLASYVMAKAKSDKLARKTDAASIKNWELVSRVMISLAVKLRITSHSQTHPERAGRARQNAGPVSYYQSGALDDE